MDKIKNNKIMRIKIEDYYGNDIVELKIKKELFKLHGDILIDDIIETDEYNVADIDEDENGEYVRVQLTDK